MDAQAFEAFVNRYGIKADFLFVPYSISRNVSGHKGWLSLNWKVTIQTKGAMLCLDYSQGSGYAPSSKKGLKAGYSVHHRAHDVAQECETGRGVPRPRLFDVLMSVVLDCTVLDSPSFAAWAVEYGYDPDSIKARAIYDACLTQSLQFRAMLPAAAIKELQKAAQDY